MKKIAIISALVLAIGASMAAGTMAKYSQTLEDQTAAVEAKKFQLDEVKTIDGIKLAPGEIFTTDFILDTVDTEVDMKLNFNAEMGLNNKHGVDEEFDKILIQNDCLKLYKINESGEKISDNLIKFERKTSKPIVGVNGVYGEGNGSSDITVENHGEQRYRLELTWGAEAGKDKEQTEVMQKNITTGVRLSITGEQIIK